MKPFTPFFVLARFLSFFNRSNSQVIYSGISNLEVVISTIFDSSPQEFSRTGTPYLILNKYQEIYGSIAPNSTLLDKVGVSETNLPAGGLKRASMPVS